MKANFSAALLNAILLVANNLLAHAAGLTMVMACPGIRSRDLWITVYMLSKTYLLREADWSFAIKHVYCTVCGRPLRTKHAVYNAL